MARRQQVVVCAQAADQQPVERRAVLGLVAAAVLGLTATAAEAAQPAPKNSYVGCCPACHGPHLLLYPRILVGGALVGDDVRMRAAGELCPHILCSVHTIFAFVACYLQRASSEGYNLEVRGLDRRVQKLGLEVVQLALCFCTRSLDADTDLRMPTPTCCREPRSRESVPSARSSCSPSSRPPLASERGTAAGHDGSRQARLTPRPTVLCFARARTAFCPQHCTPEQKICHVCHVTEFRAG